MLTMLPMKIMNFFVNYPATIPMKCFFTCLKNLHKQKRVWCMSPVQQLYHLLWHYYLLTNQQAKSGQK